jgi:hypothetical protein
VSLPHPIADTQTPPIDLYFRHPDGAFTIDLNEGAEVAVQISSTLEIAAVERDGTFDFTSWT